MCIRDSICIVSGGQGYNEPFPEAEGMFRYMKEKDFHVFRALQTAKAQGLKNVCGIAAGSNRLFLPNNMLREFLGEIKFLLTSYKVIA